MGQAIVRLASADNAAKLVAAVAANLPAPQVVGDISYFPAFSAEKPADNLPEFDIAIDFSLPSGFDAVLALCVKRRAGLVSGTTGLSATQHAALTAAAATIPLVWASNFSLGVAVLTALVERAAASLPGWDCDIIEAHHSHKLDAPSGTALTLGAAAQNNGVTPHHLSVRAGDIVGEHCVQLTGLGERLELIHRANHRDIFARGALHVAKTLYGRKPGHYQIKELLLNDSH